MDDYTFKLSDVINKTAIEHDNIALIRHTRSHDNFRKVWDAGIDFFEEYQRIQPENYFHGKQDILVDLQDRLVIDYGGTRNIVHVKWDTIAEKPVVGICSRVFEGYENIIWKFSDLEKYIGHEDIYSDLYMALSSVSGVYLIIDTVDYGQYIGSASGSDGIWGRWRDYLKTNGTGGNKKLKEHLEKNPGRYRKLQFTILEAIPRTGNEAKDKETAQKREVWYKRKLMTRNEETGLNMN